MKGKNLGTVIVILRQQNVQLQDNPLVITPVHSHRHIEP